MRTTYRFALVGPGRAGTAVATGLSRAGWTPVGVAARSPQSLSARAFATTHGVPIRSLDDVGCDAEVVVVATPDAEIGPAAARVAPRLEGAAALVHLAGSLGLDVFAAALTAAPGLRTAAAHPLQTFAGTTADADRLAGTWFAVEGDEVAAELAEAVGGHAFRIGDRALYHAAACIASNHLVALLGQVERVAARAGLPAGALEPLLRATLDNVVERGAAAALTGPVARGDAATVERHLTALADDERPAYRALAREALRLSGRSDSQLAGLVDGGALVEVAP